MLNSLKNLSLASDLSPNYVRFELSADDEEFCFPPAAHFIATVEDLTNTPDPCPKTSTVWTTMRVKARAYYLFDTGRPLPRMTCV